MDSGGEIGRGESRGGGRHRARAHLGFLPLLALLAVSLAGATALGYRNAVETAEALLRGQARDVALAVEAGARRSGGDRATLQGIPQERQGSAVAYAAPLAMDGAILAHTHPVRGERLADERLGTAALADRAQMGRAALQTGEEVLEATIPISARAAGRPPWVLRVARHTAVAQRGVRGARLRVELAGAAGVPATPPPAPPAGGGGVQHARGGHPAPPGTGATS